MAAYARLLGRAPWLFGVHLWNLTDFRTPQMYLRCGGYNHKGIFSRLREPKLAAHKLRLEWAPHAPNLLAPAPAAPHSAEEAGGFGSSSKRPRTT